MNQYRKHWDQIETPDFKASGPWRKQEKRFKRWYLSAAAILIAASVFFLRYEQRRQLELEQVRFAKQELLKISRMMNQSSHYLEPIKSIHNTQKSISHE